MKTNTHTEARELIAKLSPNRSRPDLTREIRDCACSPEARAGMYLVNGDWRASHTTARDLPSPTGEYWHALVHRQESNFGNSKYWLRRVGGHPIHPLLVQAARDAGMEELAAPTDVWDAMLFTDLFANPDHKGWTRKLDEIEMAELLEFSLGLS